MRMFESKCKRSVSAKLVKHKQHCTAEKKVDVEITLRANKRTVVFLRNGKAPIRCNATAMHCLF